MLQFGFCSVERGNGCKLDIIERGIAYVLAKNEWGFAQIKIRNLNLSHEFYVTHQ